jgi:hypothetical protein
MLRGYILMNYFSEVIKLIPVDHLGLINGKLLGDGNLSIEKNRSPRLRFQHRILDKDWTLYCYDSLKDFIPLAPPKYKKDRDLRVKAGYSESFYVQSKTSPVFTYLKGQWYNGKVKILPLDLLYSTLTPEALAWWYQDDGHLLIKDNIAKKIILSTDNFTPHENNLLIELLVEKFKLQFSLDGQNRLCLYDQRQILYFFHLIGDYIHPSMNRKRLPLNLEPIQLEIKRTTVYLPFKLKQPTKDIRKLIEELRPLQFIKVWFQDYQHNNHKDDFPWIGHQVTLKQIELDKINRVKKETGITMSEIITLIYKRSLP